MDTDDGVIVLKVTALPNTSILSSVATSYALVLVVNVGCKESRNGLGLMPLPVDVLDKATF